MTTTRSTVEKMVSGQECLAEHTTSLRDLRVPFWLSRPGRQVLATACTNGTSLRPDGFRLVMELNTCLSDLKVVQSFWTTRRTSTKHSIPVQASSAPSQSLTMSQVKVKLSQ